MGDFVSCRHLKHSFNLIARVYYLRHPNTCFFYFYFFSPFVLGLLFHFLYTLVEFLIVAV
jgi:hypothetical protein